MVAVLGAPAHSEILPRRLHGRGGASAVAAMDAATEEEISMLTPKSKHQTRARPNAGKTAGRSHAAQATTHKTAKRAAGTKSAFGQQPRSAPRQTGRAESKQAHIIAMLRAPNGATIDAMAQATGWQPHSVRGFLAGVIRKKLGLNLVSGAAGTARVYRITELHGSSTVAGAKNEP